MEVLLRFAGSIKAPYVLLVVMMATATACYMMVHPDLDIAKAAFIFAATLIGGFGSKALLAVVVRAFKTVLVMVFCALLLLLVAVTATEASVFKDSAVEGVSGGVAASIIVVIGALLERHQDTAR